MKTSSGTSNRIRLTRVIQTLPIVRLGMVNHISAFLLFLTITSIVYAGPVVRVPVHAQSDAELIITTGGDILCGSTNDSLLVEFPTNQAYQEFQRLWQGNPVRYVASDVAQLLGPITRTTDELDDYHTYATAAAEVLAFVQHHPTIAKVDTFGRSRQNRAILHLKISDSVNVNRDIPRVYIVAGTHGNELIAVEVVLRYLSWLDSNITTDTAMLRRISQMELHFVPIHNVDGYDMHTRYNAANVDLNRNFPFHWGWQAVNFGPAPMSEPEDYKLDSLLAVILPCISADYHSWGGQVLRPYSYYTREPPDSALLRAVSHIYHSHINPYYYEEMGSQLYWHGGEHNDWNYTQRGNPGLTIELWNGGDYNPPIDSIYSVTRPHRDAINALIDRAMGNQITGFIRDSVTLLPLSNARWKCVSQWDTGFVERKVLPNGRYRWLREPGPVTLRFSAPEYQSRTLTVNIDSTGAPTVVNVYLQSSHCSLSGTIDVTNRRSIDTLTASTQFQSVVLDTAGRFFFGNLSAQPDTILISGFNYEPLKIPLTLASLETTVVHGWTLRMLPPVLNLAETQQGIAEIFWHSPYNDSLTRSRIRGYAVWRDGEDYIPLTYDTVFAEPISDVTRRIYQLQTIYRNGASILGDSIPLTPIEKYVESPIVKRYGIGKGYPNPFNSIISVPYRLRINQSASIIVFDRLGRTIRSVNLVSGRAGVWHWFPAIDHASGGIYFLQINLNGITETRKIVYLP